MDVSFKEFRLLCVMIIRENSYLKKTERVHNFITDRGKSEEDIFIIIKSLLPGVTKLTYNLSDKQLVKIFNKLLRCDMSQEALDIGDVAYVIGAYLKKTNSLEYAFTSTLMLHEVDEFLIRLSSLTKEADQIKEFKKIITRCTPNDLRQIIRLIKHDLRINMGAKHVLEALHKNAYRVFKLSSNLKHVIAKFLDDDLSLKVHYMTPVQPMLALACKSFSEIEQKCIGDIFLEFKYDGERIQIHKRNNDYKFFSRSLKPVTPYKVAELEDLISSAFPSADDIILDGEIILVDQKTNNPLPFGSLGVNKKQTYTDVCICVFVFDCLYFNDDLLIKKPLHERRKILKENIFEIPNQIVLSEMRIIKNNEELVELLNIVLSKGIEGFIAKDSEGEYEPGMRRWIKIKKNYLDHGCMIDKADLAVLGAYYGKGNNSGLLSSFLMGCYDESSEKWCTVVKCSGGHSCLQLQNIREHLKVVPFNKSSIPSWLNVNKVHYPDVVISDVEEAPVWEIAGAEFTKSPSHTAASISIRFPRCVRVRDDKDYKAATTLEELISLYTKSKEAI
ncbi:ORF-20 [Teiidae poxvirus 1]|nr:ORF-20 [Teiidae poxvirus 1]